ncbi:hypothetical protein BRD56_09180 [Thermoplasmatales archaeon SW_10_69_26]|jgi:N-acetylglutamate synthase-like GNAT family acetyltransferase|nr:MAG: hypothetical protein BRD56_09180 [Thermoplasmatales archaeon SW_10_69_26]
MGEDTIEVHRTSDDELIESLVPDHPHLTRPLADRETKQFIVARRDGEPVGTCWVRDMAARTGVFGGLWVEPEARGRGLGGRVMDAGLAEIALHGNRIGMLGVHLDNEEGLALARSRGFHTVSFVPGRSTSVGSVIGDWVERASPLPFPDRSTRLMAVWLGEERLKHRPAPEPSELEQTAGGTNGGPETPEPSPVAAEEPDQ